MNLSIKGDMLSSAFGKLRMPITFCKSRIIMMEADFLIAKAIVQSGIIMSLIILSESVSNEKKRYIEDKVKQLESAHLFTENVTF